MIIGPSKVIHFMYTVLNSKIFKLNQQYLEPNFYDFRDMKESQTLSVPRNYFHQ